MYSTRLRQSLLSAIPDLTEIKRDTSNRYELAFDYSKALLEISTHDCNSEVFLLSQAAKILCRHIFKHKKKFTGTLSSDSQNDFITPILLTFMQMLLDGPGIAKNFTPEKASTAVQSLSQLVTFNSVKQR